MTSIPDRPEDHPDQWISAFWYFDKLHTDFDMSTPNPHDTRQAAVAAAQSAKENNDGGGVVVMFGYAYPPVGASEEPYVVDFHVRQR